MWVLLLSFVWSNENVIVSLLAMIETNMSKRKLWLGENVNICYCNIKWFIWFAYNSTSIYSYNITCVHEISVGSKGLLTNIQFCRFPFKDTKSSLDHSFTIIIIICNKKKKKFIHSPFISKNNFQQYLPSSPRRASCCNIMKRFMYQYAFATWISHRFLQRIQFSLLILSWECL